jgi:hypothetical protein
VAKHVSQNIWASNDASKQVIIEWTSGRWVNEC